MRLGARPSPVNQVVDTTGAGDSYAAGFLYGHIRGLDPAQSARLGGLAAAEIVGHLGRPTPTIAGHLGGHHERRELAAAVRLAPVVGSLAAGAAACLVGTF